MDVYTSAPSLLTYYLAAIVFIVLILVLVSFVLSSRRSSRVENSIDDIQERLQASEVALEDAKRSLDELFGRKHRGELKVPDQRYNLTQIVYEDDEGEEHNLKDTISDMCNELEQLRTEHANALEGIQKDQQGLVHAVSQIKTLISALPGNAAANAAQRNAAAASNQNAKANNTQPNNRNDRKAARAAQQNAAKFVMTDNSRRYEPQSTPASDDGMFDPQTAFNNQQQKQAQQDEPFDASFAQTASDIAKLVGTVDFSKIDPNAGPATIGEHIANAGGQIPEQARKQRQNQQQNYAQQQGQAANKPHQNRSSGGRDPLNPLGMAFGADPTDRTHSLGATHGAPRQELPHEGTFIEVEVDPRPASAVNADKIEDNQNLDEQHDLVSNDSAPRRDAAAVLNDVFNAASSIIDSVDEALASTSDEIKDDFGSKSDSNANGVMPYVDEIVLPNTALNDAERAALAGTFGNSEASSSALSDDAISNDSAAQDDTALAAVSRAEQRNDDAQAASQSSSHANHRDHAALAASAREASASDAGATALGTVASEPKSMGRMYNQASGVTVGEDACGIQLSSDQSEPGFGKGLDKAVTYEKSGQQPKLDSMSEATDKTQLTIDFAPSESLDIQKLKVSVTKHNGSSSELPETKDIIGDMSAANVSYSKTDKNSGDTQVVDMIYDADYVRKQKDQKPFGIDINTLDKAHTFIEAGVSLTELSARTGLSEDELSLLYEVDENGKVIDNSAPFRAKVDNHMDDESASNDDVDHTQSHDDHNDAVDAMANSNGSDSESVSLESPSDALDNDERAVIESIMGKKKEPSYVQTSDDVELVGASADGDDEKDEAESLRGILQGAANADDEKDEAESLRGILHGAVDSASEEKDEAESLAMSFGGLSPDDSEQIVSAQVEIGEAEDLAKIIAGGVADEDEEKHEEEMLAESLANASAAKTADDYASETAGYAQAASFGSDSDDDEKNEEESLAQIIAEGMNTSRDSNSGFDKHAALESLESDDFEENLEAIDRLADTIIQENLAKDQARRAAAAVAAAANNRSESVSQNDYEAALAGALGISVQEAAARVAESEASRAAVEAAAAEAISANRRIYNSTEAIDASQEIAHAMSFDNLDVNRDYLHDLNADIDEELADDSVTIGGQNVTAQGAETAVANAASGLGNQGVGAGGSQSRQRGANAARMMSAGTNTTARNNAREAVARAAQAEADAYAGALASDDNVESNAARAAAAAAAVHSARRKALAEQGRIGAVGSATSERKEKIDPYEMAEVAARTAREAAARAQAQAAQEQAAAQASAQANASAYGTAPVGTQSSGRGINAMLGHGTQVPTHGQISQTPARSAPLSIGAVNNPRGATNFSAVTAMNPGMADVVAMAPMALGTVETPAGTANAGLAPGEDPSDILSQVISGGLNSVSSLSEDQLALLNDLQSNGTAGPHYANYQARNAYGISRR